MFIQFKASLNPNVHIILIFKNQLSCIFLVRMHKRIFQCITKSTNLIDIKSGFNKNGIPNGHLTVCFNTNLLLQPNIPLLLLGTRSESLGVFCPAK